MIYMLFRSTQGVCCMLFYLDPLSKLPRGRHIGWAEPESRSGKKETEKSYIRTKRGMVDKSTLMHNTGQEDKRKSCN